ncbi:Bcr/CflA family drug resistance efflux transporter [Cereibacter changlensis JA139]|uniref:Bcr/CflA family efflux transporter n=2 Tax=Cereibacter changlensis TaxID=402884 RepID=A0A2T4K0E4_9RHOB|nr:multidrug effflux MFS transporter [Cereibacter changlensis]PTE23618.1 Bcr/CflA family drug resistance efflux transporter [Cereibacter changlensis JA139]PZX54325.1 DHA1 family bicyclomycin/chloramphenicol resistance-like MFS transporter [Cereibacter changlensis]
MASSLLRSAHVLGALSSVGPFAIDMYLPALPAIGADLGSSVTAMQSTITAYFLAFGVAQLVYGPWADQAGRRLPLYVGLAIFFLGSVVCTLAGSAEMLLAGRFVQGLGGAAVMVVPRAIIRDLHTGHEATRLMAAIMLVISVSPMLAPLAGAGLIAVADWRAIFAVLSLGALASLVMTRFALRETLPPEARQPVRPRALLAAARMLLGHRSFLGLTLLGGFGMASFFVFIASASFVYTEQFGMSPTGFSLAFAVNAIGFFGASQMAAGLGLRFGAVPVVLAAAAGFAASTVALFALALMGLASLPVVMAGLFVANGFLGLVIPTTMVLALEEHGEHAGLASSLGGTLQMLVGGAMIVLTGPFFDGSVVPMLGAIAVCGVMAFALSRIVVPRQAALA